MSGTFPISPLPKDAELHSNQPVIESISSSGRRQSRIVDGHLWLITCTYDKMERDKIAPLFAFSINQIGSSFDVILPQFASPLCVGTGSPTSSSSGSVGDNTINATGFTSVTGVMKAGDIIKFANHTKVYMLTADVNSGSATLSFQPKLIEPVPSGQPIIIRDVPFRMFFDDNILKWKTTAPTISTYTLKLKESIQ